MEFPNPLPFMFFTSYFSLNITLWDPLNDHDRKVIHGVSTSIEVLSHYRFLCFLFSNVVFSDVVSVGIEADVEGILCRADIPVLFSALLALYQVDHTL